MENKNGYYECMGKKKNGKSFCDSGAISKDILNNTVLKYLKEEFLIEENYNYRLAIFNDNFDIKLTNLRCNIEPIELELNENKEQMEKVTNDYYNRQIDVGTFNRLKNQIQQEQDCINEKLAKLKSYIKKTEKDRIHMEEEVKKIPDLLNNWDSLTIQQQKSALFKFIDRIMVYKQAGRLINFIEFQMVYLWDDEGRYMK
jgi:hypothetical protein